MFTREPYSTKGERNTRNANDGIYNRAGDQLLLTLTPDGDGYAATFGVGLQMT